VPRPRRRPYEVAVGPIHAGVIESGHFRFHLVGDRISTSTRSSSTSTAGWSGRRGKTLDEGLAYASRACAACAVTNAFAYAHACEDALGLVPHAELARAARSCSSSSGCGATSTTSRPSAPGRAGRGNSSFAALTERAAGSTPVTGHRFLFGSVGRRQRARPRR
jgi:hypothetical protein